MRLPMPTANDVLARLETLRTKHAEASRVEAVATNQYQQAQRVVEEARAELKALGIDPDKAEEQLATEVAELDAEITKVETEIGLALQNYAEVDAAYRKVEASR